ncbi:MULTISPECIES: XRE family transcriptional regulator [unclassified Pseudoalteromonas]|uniref:helix-turn-helix domain-containing protein n=1 Tax=unclassified Pseudoalteromonas TaxID=194690 RepID=UPI0025B2E5A5|nr:MULTISPECIES: XRE family transcriptional regulator [unclassified Pseudoalteromonas]MDN3394604.1 XRE family transcriptional regulator [Pseudoalteromonas sp. APC 3215]MDN3469664.1 XRE family transcriptional regulator [Pseudoalteromonas sp. APC 4026]
MTIGSRIKNQRLKLGFSQAGLADQVGLTQQTLQKIENGTTKNPRRIEEIAKFLKCTPEYLQFGVGSEEMTQQELCEKIRFFRITALNISTAEFSNKFSIPEQVLAEIEAGESKLADKAVEKILRYEDFSHLQDWFSSPELQPEIPPKPTKVFNTEADISWFDDEDHTPNNNVSLGPTIKSTVPLVSWVQAGAWSEINEVRECDATRYMCPVNSSDKTFALKVQGVSMEPKFYEGDLIFVDPEAECIHGSYVVARLDDNNEATFKQLIIESGQKFLKAANPNWPEQLIPINGNCTLVGKVIFTGKSL